MLRDLGEVARPGDNGLLDRRAQQARGGRGYGVRPPYVLVAHSLGGLFSRLYAQLHPGQVAGLVLVDTFSTT